MTLVAALGADVADSGVRFVLRVENGGAEPVALAFGSGQTGEFVARDGGEVVWRWSDGRVFTQQVRRETLAPGEAVVAEAEWADPPPGSYAVEATLTATDRRPTASATVTI